VLIDQKIGFKTYRAFPNGPGYHYPQTVGERLKKENCGSRDHQTKKMMKEKIYAQTYRPKHSLGEDKNLPGWEWLLQRKKKHVHQEKGGRSDQFEAP